MRVENMIIELESMGVEMPRVERHPNRIDFRGVLTMVDVPSQRAPGGSKGNRVILTRKAAESALPSLIGMALDYSPAFDGHDARRKVGVITHADVIGRKLEVGGYLFAKDFPEIVEEVGRFRRQKGGPRTSDLRQEKSRSVGRGSDGAGLRGELSGAVKEIRNLIAGGTHGQPMPLRLRGESVRERSGTGLGMSFEATNVQVLDRRAKTWILTEVTFTGAAILRKDKAAYSDTWIELVQ
jgi:hypothetical protein